MRIKPCYQLKNIAGDFVVIESGSDVVDLAKSFLLNETAAFLFDAILKENEASDLAELLKKEYDVTEEQAIKDVEEFITFLRQKNILE